MLTEAQIRKIHALKSDLALSDENYRAVLAGFTRDDGTIVSSSKELTIQQASSLIDSLEKLVERLPEIRDRTYASPKQVRLISALWRNVSRAENYEGRRRTLDAFLRRHFHVRQSNHLPRRVVPKIIKSLRIMNERGM